MNKKQMLAIGASGISVLIVLVLAAAMLHMNIGKPDNTAAINPNQTPTVSGKSFTAQEIPITSSSLMMNTIQAYSPNQVYAFGNDNVNGTPLEYQWNGVKWTSQPQINNAQAVYVSELNQNDIWELAVLTTTRFQPYELFHWNGYNWTQKQLNEPDAVDNGPFAALSDTNMLFIFTVTGKGIQLHHYNGSQITTVSIPVPISNLTDMAAISPTNVWISGRSADKNFNPAGALLLNWNGSKVTAYSNPLQNDPTASLAGISGDSAGDVWTVGDNSAGAIIEHWNGDAWSSVMPSFNIANTLLNSVKAFSPNDVWVGGNQNGQPFAAVYNGATWTQQTITSDATTGFINSISGTTANDVWLTGEQVTGPNIQQGIIKHWNGSAFTTNFLSGSAQTGGESLQSIAAISPTDVWTADQNGTFLAHMDNGSITKVPIQMPFSNVTALLGYSDTDIWLFGRTLSLQNYIISRWNGAQFSIVPLPAAFTSDTFLGVTSAGTDSFYLMFENNTNNTTELLKYTGSSWVTESPSFLQDKCNFLPPASDKKGSVYIVEQCNDENKNYITGTIWYSSNGSAWNKIQGFDTIVKSIFENAPKSGIINPNIAAILPFSVSDIDLILQGFSHIYVIHRNGAMWTMLPTVLNQTNPIWGPTPVNAVSSQDIWIFTAASEVSTIAHWDGVKWTDYSSTNQSDKIYALADIQGTPWLAGISGADNNPVLETLQTGA